MAVYKIDKKEGFIIEDYNNAKPFSSFLPGIAGKKGIPMWLYYVNRGQCVACFGIKDKDGSMMEFYPAYKSYQFTSNYGFRTFIKFDDGSIMEPFNEDRKYENGPETLKIKTDQFKIEHNNSKKGLKIDVTYNTVPNEDFAGLVREVNIENLTNEEKTIEILDGMPTILPYGIEYEDLKALGHTLRAWMDVVNLENNIPFYKLRGSTTDSAEVNLIEKGHFYMAFEKDENGNSKLLKPIVDPNVIFGTNKSKVSPECFMNEALDELLEKEQVVVNKVPCGFFGTKKVLKANEKVSLISFIGNVSNIDKINENANDIISSNYINKKRDESDKLLTDLIKSAEIKTSDDMFDAYTKQNYLDNILRGGYPLIFEGEDKNLVYHIYSRKHGDLERDYNFFTLEPGYYSQGNGNFRDANQNRRSDVIFNPEVGDFNVKMFMNLIQADGYNPLVVKGCKFIVDEDKKEEILELVESKNDFKKFIDVPYTPGEFYEYISSKKIELKIDEDKLLNKMLMNSEQNIEAKHGEGFWIDHWTYNLDLVETYLAIFPETQEEFVFDRKDYKYYDDIARVRGRDEKYVFVNDKVRQYEAVEEENVEKERLVESRKIMKNWVRTENGKGEIYKTNLYEKLLSLAVIKFGTMDILGVGVEMEAGKPGWNDSLNGLPGMLGSGVSESFEIKRVLDFLVKQNKDRDVEIPIELRDLLIGIDKQLDIYFDSDSDNKDFEYWDEVSALREKYREEVFFGISGKTAKLVVADISIIIEKFIKKLEKGKKLALELGKGIFPTYLYFEATEYEMLRDKDGNQLYNEKGYPNVKVKKLEPKKLPYFLEAPAKAMKTLKEEKEKKELYKNLKESNVYDKKLKMYKVCESLLSESYDIGRARIFTPGWLENESIFLHMEYKYLLSLLKAELYDEFYNDVKTAFVPFMTPDVYGRSTLENSSFIASSANPDKSVHGQGFVARLSGSTAEGLEIRNTIMTGKKPFTFEDGELVLEFEPILPEWLFDDNNEVSFIFLGKAKVTYINPNKKDTFGQDAGKITSMKLDGKVINGSKITGEDAMSVREGKIKQITIEIE